MKKRVLALILASVITLTNGNIAFAAEADNENTTDTMVMEEAVGESTQPKPEEVTESEEPEEVAEDNPAKNEDHIRKHGKHHCGNTGRCTGAGIR